MWAWVSTSRWTGEPSSATAAAKGSHWERTMRQSITVRPSSSATTPALLTPRPPPGCTQDQIPSPSFSSSTAATLAPTPGTLDVLGEEADGHRPGGEALEDGEALQHPDEARHRQRTVGLQHPGDHTPAQDPLQGLGGDGGIQPA